MSLLDTVGRDARLAARTLRKTPLVTLVAVLVIALGTGAVTTIFSAVNALLLRPLPGAAEPERLVDVERTQADGSGSLSASHPYYQHLR
ncbi:MAG TPA: ABC transporter permease, partial [Thermoanaerobaculia bacterium]|nr:ABC transporter permease [Thermoanaerobaculia bacterium]